MLLKRMIRKYENKFPRLVESMATVLLTLPLGWSKHHEDIIIQAVRNKRLRGEYKGAGKLLGKLPETDIPLRQATRLDGHGRVYHDLEDFVHAEECYSQGLMLVNDVSRSESRQASLLNNLGHNFTVRDDGKEDLEEAKNLLGQSLDIYGRLNNQEGIAYVLLHMGELARVRGDFKEARKRLQEMLEIENRIGNKAGSALGYHQSGRVAFAEGNFSAAEKNFRKAYNLNRAVPLCRRQRADILTDLGGALVTQRQDASSVLGEAGKLYRQMELSRKVEYVKSLESR